MKVFITGGTGLIGRHLTKRLLERGDEVRILSRSAGRVREALGGGVIAVEGDPARAGDWMKALEGIDAVVNLVGEPIMDKAWTEAQRTKLRSSRIDATGHVVQGIKAATVRPSVMISASAVGYYGDRGDQEIDEETPAATDFTGRLCADWELAARPVEALGVRLVLLRIGIVLAPKGGALEKMVLPFRLFAGGPVGRPGQWMPWIHIDDLVGVILFAIDQNGARGPINGTGPHPATTQTLASTLGKVLHRPSWIPVPAAAIKLIFGTRAGLLLASQRVLPRKAEALGFSYRYPELEGALRACLP